MSDPLSTAEERKRAGNEMFSKGKLEAAIEAYSEAICFAPATPVYYTNRAMCHRKKESWHAALSDCDAALALDSSSIKGHYLKGVALDALGSSEEAGHHLWRALELCKERTVSYRDDIQRAMLTARRRHWENGTAASEVQVGVSRELYEMTMQSPLSHTHAFSLCVCAGNRHRAAAGLVGAPPL